MKIKVKKIIITFIFILGVLILLYPVVAKIISLNNQTVAITNYKKKVDTLTDEEVQKLFDEYNNYNKSLYENNNFRVDLSEIENATSSINLLNIGEMIGYIEIPKININLPIYEGSNTEVLTNGIGHMQNTSLPCGGYNTHSVLVGHTGLAKAKMFDDIDKLEINDKFSICYLNQKLNYKVCDIRVVKPDETECLQIHKDEDLITLVTCTPRHVNTHRLLVTGKRSFEEENIDTKEVKGETESPKLYNVNNKNIILLVLIIIILFLMLIYINLKLKRKEKKKYEN